MPIDPQTFQDILDIEWQMFHAVQGIDGPAACQHDRGTFDIMRASQLAAWNDETAASYLDDLWRAAAAGRNLMTEKYARMMEYTSPCEYRRVASQLPTLEREAEPLIEHLSRLSVEWMEQTAAKYPHVGAQGRPLRSESDNAYTPSFETYNRGELATYSANTLRLLRDHYLALAADGVNPAEVILEHTVKQYGYASLERAEAVQAARAEKRRTGQD
jgi:hypothetical protein